MHTYAHTHTHTHRYHKWYTCSGEETTATHTRTHTHTYAHTRKYHKWHTCIGEETTADQSSRRRGETGGWGDISVRGRASWRSNVRLAVYTCGRKFE